MKDIKINTLARRDRTEQTHNTQREIHCNIDTIQKSERLSNHTSKKTQINLDLYCRRKGISPDIIKIDAEGSEIEILKGAKTIIIKYKPIIFLSLHPYHIKKIGNDIHDLSSILSEIKYDIIDNKSPVFGKLCTLSNKKRTPRH